MSRSFDSITHNNDEDHHHAPTPSQQQQVSKNGKPSLPSQNTTKNENNQHSTSSSFVHCHNFLDKIFTNCSNDPVGNVHRTWSITLLMMAIYLIITIFQIIHLHASNRSSNNNNNNNNNNGSSTSSPALLLACIWHGMMQLIMIGLMGTFIMKRFPTSFAIGFLFGTILVFVNQNLIYMITFTHYNNNHSAGNDADSNSRLYSAFSLLLAIVLCVFGMLLFHFQKYIIVAPIDAKGFSRSGSPTSTAAASTKQSSVPTTTYQRYDDGSEA